MHVHTYRLSFGTRASTAEAVEDLALKVASGGMTDDDRQWVVVVTERLVERSEKSRTVDSEAADEVLIYLTRDQGSPNQLHTQPPTEGYRSARRNCHSLTC